MCLEDKTRWRGPILTEIRTLHVSKERERVEKTIVKIENVEVN